MPYGKQHKRIARSVSRRVGDDDSRIAPPPAGTRVCARPAYSTALQQPASGGRGLAVSSPAETAKSEAREGRVDHFTFDQPSCARLPDHESWPAPPRT